MLGSESQVIHQLRVHGAGNDPMLTRLRADHLLNMVDFSPSRLSPAAVLCIRTLRDPLPGTLRLDDAQAFPDRAWQSAIHNALNELAESATRPITGSVPANAQAVLFADRAEMLACLALDWQRGQVGQQWWWRGLLRGDLPAAAVAMWHASPEYIPSALARLGGAAISFVQALPLSDVQRLIEAVITRYDLSELKTTLSTEPASRGDLAPVPVTIIPPWRAFLSESRAVTLAPLRELLLGVALTLIQQPAVARSVSFARAVQLWLSAHSSVAAQPDAPPSPAVPPDAPTAPPEASPTIAPVQRTDETAPRLPDTSDALTRVSQWQYEEIEVQPSAHTPSAPDAMDAHPSADDPVLPDASLPSAADDMILIISNYGGVFYLFNAFIALGLYGDFTMPRPSGLSLSPWDLLALMAAHLIGPTVEADPIWPLLAHLSGRGAHAPGHDFAAPDEWLIDPGWLDPFAETGGLIWSRAQGRLRVWHPAGFWCVDAAEGQPPAEAVEGVVPVPQASDSLGRWCEWLAAYLVARLRVALDLEDETDPVPTLFAHTAQIAVTPARVDITLNLTTLPIAIRYAGLDRDPGWIPAAGRTIAFRFEV